MELKVFVVRRDLKTRTNLSPFVASCSFSQSPMGLYESASCEVSITDFEKEHIPRPKVGDLLDIYLDGKLVFRGPITGWRPQPTRIRIEAQGLASLLDKVFCAKNLPDIYLRDLSYFFRWFALHAILPQFPLITSLDIQSAGVTTKQLNVTQGTAKRLLDHICELAGGTCVWGIEGAGGGNTLFFRPRSSKVFKISPTQIVIVRKEKVFKISPMQIVRKEWETTYPEANRLLIRGGELPARNLLPNPSFELHDGEKFEEWVLDTSGASFFNASLRPMSSLRNEPRNTFGTLDGHFPAFYSGGTSALLDVSDLESGSVKLVLRPEKAIELERERVYYFVCAIWPYQGGPAHLRIRKVGGTWRDISSSQFPPAGRGWRIVYGSYTIPEDGRYQVAVEVRTTGTHKIIVDHMLCLPAEVPFSPFLKPLPSLSWPSSHYEHYITACEVGRILNIEELATNTTMVWLGPRGYKNEELAGKSLEVIHSFARFDPLRDPSEEPDLTGQRFTIANNAEDILFLPGVNLGFRIGDWIRILNPDRSAYLSPNAQPMNLPAECINSEIRVGPLSEEIVVDTVNSDKAAFLIAEAFFKLCAKRRYRASLSLHSPEVLPPISGYAQVIGEVFPPLPIVRLSFQWPQCILSLELESERPNLQNVIPQAVRRQLEILRHLHL